MAAESRKLHSSSESEDYTRARIPPRSRKQSRKVRTNHSSNVSETGSARQRASSDGAAVLDSRLRSASVGSQTQKLPSLQKSLEVRPQSPLEPSPITPSLTPGIGTTDDEDTDFQSAYSVSPRDSYSESLDHHSSAKNMDASDMDELSTPTMDDTAFSARQRNLITIPRNRAASNATAVPHPDTDASEDTVGEHHQSMNTRG